jgi:hypothetical protein
MAYRGYKREKGYTSIWGRAIDIIFNIVDL